MPYPTKKLKIKRNNNLVLKVIKEIHNLSVIKIANILCVNKSKVYKWLADKEASYFEEFPSQFLELFIRKIKIKTIYGQEKIIVKPNKNIDILNKSLSILENDYYIVDVVDSDEFGKVFILQKGRIKNETNRS